MIQELAAQCPFQSANALSIPGMGSQMDRHREARWARQEPGSSASNYSSPIERKSSPSERSFL